MEKHLVVGIAEKRRTYYEKNKYRICKNTLDNYCYKAIERIRIICPDLVNYYLKIYPFEKYAELPIKRELRKRGIYPSQDLHDDCYDAGMLAYLYSIHRCAVMNYKHTEAYIKKMICIYITCAIIIYYETRNLCQVNGFREIKLDVEYLSRYY